MNNTAADIGPPELSPEKLAYSIAEAANALGMSRDTVYRAIKDGRLTAIHWGGRLLVRRDAMEKLLDTLAEAPPTPGLRRRKDTQAARAREYRWGSKKPARPD